MQDRRTAFTTDAPVALDPATQSLVAGGIKEQTKPVLKNLGQVLAATGSPLERVLETIACCVAALKAK